jgi:hypothetical protein
MTLGVYAMGATHDLGDSQGAAVSVVLTSFGASTRVARDTKDGRSLGLVEVRQEGGKEELGVGGVAAGVRDTSGSLGLFAAVELCSFHPFSFILL